jgi:hypothetical protein
MIDADALLPREATGTSGVVETAVDASVGGFYLKTWDALHGGK